MPGILPYINFNPKTGSREADDVWVMISQEKWGADKNKWDYFNGKVDKGETLKEAAAREGYEESCGLFGKIDELYKKMIGLSSSYSGFLINAEDFKSKQAVIRECTPEEYLKRKAFNQYAASCYQEKKRVKWVRLSALVDACARDKILQHGTHRLEIRSPLAKLINKNSADFKHLLTAQKNSAKVLDLQKNKLEDKIDQDRSRIQKLNQELIDLQGRVSTNKAKLDILKNK